MRITRVEAFPIHAPRAHRFVGARAVLTYSDFAIVVIETDAEITGFGEVSSALYYYRLGQSHALDINAYLEPAFLTRIRCGFPHWSRVWMWFSAADARQSLEWRWHSGT